MLVSCSQLPGSQRIDERTWAANKEVLARAGPEGVFSLIDKPGGGGGGRGVFKTLGLWGDYFLLGK